MTVPGKAVKTIFPAMQDVRAALDDNALANSTQESIDHLDFNLAHYLENIDVEINNVQEEKCSEYKETNTDEAPCNFEIRSDQDCVLRKAGDCIHVYWPLEHKCCPGTVHSIYEDTKHIIHYDYEDVETLELENEIWKFDKFVSGTKPGTSNFNITLKNTEQDPLSEMFSALGNRSFLQHEA